VRGSAAVIGFSAAALALAAFSIATFYFSFCILLENDCHALGRPKACRALAETLRFCSRLYAASLFSTTISVAAFLHGRRRANGRRTPG
jgi:hypothetical protein